MRFIFFSILLLSSSFLFAQTKPGPPPPPPPSPAAGDSIIFTKVDIEASVDRKAWIAHLQKELQPIIDKAAKRMKPGTYTVNVRFLVERDGSISYVEALNDPGKGLAKGAMQVVKSGPRWTPGEQNGRKVRSYHTQPITFVFTEE